MKLQIKMLPAWGSTEKYIPLLCDEEGKPLPQQRRVTIDAPVGEATICTVEFIVDDELIKIVGTAEKAAS